MADEGPLLGVTAVSPTPATRLEVLAPALPSPPEPPAWPPAAQWTTAALVVVFLGLLAWRGLGLSRFGTRPLRIEDDAGPRDAIDLNDADVVDLRLIPGVGESLARRILQHREESGPFRSLDELRRVKGIGPAMLERMRPYLRIGTSDEEPMLPPRVVRGAALQHPELPKRPAAEPGQGKKKPPPAGKIDVNHATAEQLRTLPGIGPMLSARIVEARRQQPFRKVDDLRRVKGIGAKTLARLRPYITVGDDGE
jgi:competence protein ComEA